MTKSGIEEFAGNEITFIKGQNLVNRNRIIAKNDSKNLNHYTGKVFDSDNAYLVDLIVKNNSVISYSCSCQLSKPCIHVVGVLIKLFIHPKIVKQSAHKTIIANLAKQELENKKKQIIDSSLDDEASFDDKDSYEQLNWSSAEISFIHSHTNYENNEKIHQFSFKFFNKNKVLTPICENSIFAKMNSKDPFLLVSSVDHFSYKIPVNAFNQVDLKILKFLITNQLDFRHHRNYELRNKPMDAFWINRKIIFDMLSMIKHEYKIKTNPEVAKFLEENSKAFRMILDSPNKYILYSKVDRNKYRINLMIKQNNKKWINANEVSVTNDGKLTWSEPGIVFWKNKQNLDTISLVENSLPDSYFHYYFSGVNEFKYTDESGVFKNIFDFIPKTVIELNFNKREKVIKHRIRYFYPGKPPFNVLATDDNSKTNKKRLWIYEKSIINSLSSFYFGSKASWHIKLKKITSLKMKELNNIIINYNKFKQTPIVEYKINKNLITEHNFDFKFKKIFIKDDKLVIECDSCDFTIEKLKEISQSYLNRCEVYIDDDFYVDLTTTHNIKFLDFWSKFDYYNAFSPKEGVFVFPKYRIFDLYFAFKKDDALVKKHVDKSVYDLIKDFNSKKIETFKVPAIFKNVLRPYQVDGFKWMKLLFHYNLGGVLADDMGLGKTIQTIALLYDAHISNNINKPSLIVVPTSLVHNWKTEFSKFAKELDVVVIEGDAREREKLINSNKKGIEITSFSTFRKDIKSHKSKNYHFFILDEAQNIKNNNTDLKSCVKQIFSNHNLALTGTPLINNVLELWSIFDFAIPGLFGTAADFLNDYEKRILKDNGSIMLDRLKQKVLTFCLRRTKEKVLAELPLKTQTDIIVNLHSEHQNFYNKWYFDFKNKITNLVTNNSNKKDLNSLKFHVFTMINDLRQISCSPKLKDPTFNGKNAKLDACIDLINQAVSAEKKVLVFTQYLGMIDILKEELSKNNINYYVLSGKTKKNDRIVMVDKFNKDNTPVFLSTLKTGGVGLNLVGAEVVIHYDLWWNTAIQNQATDRVHRIGQKKPVNVYRLIVDNSIEQRIVAIQEKKKNLIKNIISDDQNILSNISIDELLNLFDINYQK